MFAYTAAFFVGQGPVFAAEFFVVPKNEGENK